MNITERKKAEETLEERVAERTAAWKESNFHLTCEIEERKQVEKALRKVQRRYQAVVEDQTEVICRLSPEGKYLFVNDTYCRFFGRTKEELIGNLWIPLTTPDDMEQARTELSLISSRNPIVTIENRVVAADGTLRWVQFVNRGLFDSDGSLSEIQCVGRDITHQKEMEARLKESESRFRALFYQAVDGILFSSIEEEYLLVNEAFARMHGYSSPQEMGNLRLQDLDTPETVSLLPERTQRLMAGESLTFEVKHYRKDGSVFPLEVSAQIIESNGKRYFLGFHQDITERKEAEKALRESEEKYRTLIEDSIDGVMILKGDQIIFVNTLVQIRFWLIIT